MGRFLNVAAPVASVTHILASRRGNHTYRELSLEIHSYLERMMGGGEVRASQRKHEF